jgi:uncharacterized protein (TIGR03067 family)
MKTLASLTLALLALSVAAAEEGKETKLDPAKLVGEWKYVSGVRGGDKVEKDRLVGKVVITKDTFTIPGGPDAKFVIAYKIDNKTSPAKIDFDIKSGPVAEGKSIGIIAFDGDKLKVCYVPVMDKDAKRPAKFESTKDNQAFYFVLERVK